VLQLRPFIALRAENRLPGHKRPPCTDGLLNFAISFISAFQSTFIISSSVIND